jgi:fatty-acyl-CoA synthase
MLRCRRLAARSPAAKALTFFPGAEDFARAHVWAYADLMADVMRAANAFQTSPSALPWR